MPILLDAAVSGSATQHILLARSICSARSISSADALRRFRSYCAVWCGAVWCGVVWCGVLVGEQGTVLSLPPLTNALHTKVELGTRSILVECSSSESLDVCREAMLELLTNTIAIFEPQQQQQQQQH